MASAPALPQASTGGSRQADHGRLALIDAARALAALAILLFHADRAVRQSGGAGFSWMTKLEHGVDFFFVLSGFVIMYVHGRHIGRPETVGGYLAKRAIRIFPLLWLVVLAYAGARWLNGASPDAAVLLRSLIPYPSLEDAAPQVIWILRHEMLFYLAFAVLLLSARLGLALFAVWAIAVVVQLAFSLVGAPVAGIGSFYLSAYALNFMLGMALAMLHMGRRFRPSIWPLIAGALLLAGYLACRDGLGLGVEEGAGYTAPGDTLGVLILGLIFLLITHGLLRLEGAWRPPRFLLAMGAASYALYLVHTPVNSLVQGFAGALPEPALAWGGGHALFAMAGIAMAFAVYLFFEKPALSFLRLRLLGKVNTRVSLPQAIERHEENDGISPCEGAGKPEGGSVNWFWKMFGRRPAQRDEDLRFLSANSIKAAAGPSIRPDLAGEGVATQASGFVRAAGHRARADNLPRFTGGGRGQPHAQAERMRQLRAAFTPSHPISDASLFAGRRDLLLRLIHLIEDQKLHVVLYGDRGIGKTSVLRILSELAREAHYNVTYASCGSDTDFDSLFRSLAREVPLLFHAGYEPISPEVEAGGVFADLLPDRPATVADLTTLLEAVRGTQLLIVIDEFDRVESNRMREQVAELIKNLSDRGAPVQCLIAGVASNLTALVSHIPSIRRNLIGLPIGPLSDGELREMLANAALRSGMPFSDGAEAMMIRFSNGLPYLAQLLGLHASLAAVQGGEVVVSESDVLAAVGHAVDEIRLRMSPVGLRSTDKVAERIGWNRLGELARHALLQVGNLNESDLAGLDPASIEELLVSHADEQGAHWSFREEAVVPYAWLQAKLEENAPTHAAAARTFRQRADAEVKLATGVAAEWPDRG